MTPTRGELIVKRFDIAKTAMSNEMNTWQELADYFAPRKGQIVTKTSRGTVESRDLLDSTGEDAVNIAAAGTLAQLCPLGEKWMVMVPEDKNATPAIKNWFAIASEIILDTLHSSNFYQEQHECIRDNWVFGPSCMMVMPSNKGMVTFDSLAVGTFCIAEDDEGNIEALYREIRRDIHQLVDKFGEGAVLANKMLADAYQEIKDGNVQNEGKKYTIIHAIEPREIRGLTHAIFPTDRPYTDDYVVKECDNYLISEGGYYTFPAAVPRALTSNQPDEVYGRSPCWRALPDAKMLNAIEETVMLALEKMVDPPWDVPADHGYEVTNEAGGINYYDASKPSKPEQHQYNNRIDLAEVKTETIRERIREKLHVGMFKMLTAGEERRREKTAYEVQQMLEERIQPFTPIFTALTEHGTDRIIERTFDILLRAGQIPPPPEEIMIVGGRYKVEYKSRLALSIKAANNRAIMDALQIIAIATEIDPRVRHVLKTPEAIRDYLASKGLSPEFLNTAEEIAELVAAEQQAQAQAEQAAIAEQQASAQKQGAQAVSALNAK